MSRSPTEDYFAAFETDLVPDRTFGHIDDPSECGLQNKVLSKRDTPIDTGHSLTW